MNLLRVDCTQSLALAPDKMAKVGFLLEWILLEQYNKKIFTLYYIYSSNNINKLEKIADLRPILVNKTVDASERLILAKKEFESASSQDILDLSAKSEFPNFKSLKTNMGFASNEEKEFAKLKDEFEKVKIDEAFIQKYKAS